MWPEWHTEVNITMIIALRLPITGACAVVCGHLALIGQGLVDLTTRSHIGGSHVSSCALVTQGPDARRRLHTCLADGADESKGAHARPWSGPMVISLE